jgi:hypothetical protein
VPGFTAAAALVLALGVGVKAAVFTAFQRVVLAPPPYPNPHRLVLFGLSDEPDEVPLWSYPKLQLVRDVAEPAIHPLAGLAARTLRVRVGYESLRLRVELVSASYLEMLGARPVVGRLFTPEADVVGCARGGGGREPSLLDERARRGFPRAGADAVGRLRPDPFEGLTGEVDAWLPIAWAGAIFGRAWTDEPGFALYRAVGRLAPRTSVVEARSWADGIARAVGEAFPHPLDGREVRASVQPLPEARVHPEARAAVLRMAGAALMVLLCRVRERGGATDRARGGAEARDPRAGRARRRPLPARAAAPGREADAGVDRRRGGTLRGPSHSGAAPGAGSPARRGSFGHGAARAGVRFSVGARPEPPTDLGPIRPALDARSAGARWQR